MKFTIVAAGRFSNDGSIWQKQICLNFQDILKKTKPPATSHKDTEGADSCTVGMCLLSPGPQAAVTPQTELLMEVGEYQTSTS